MTCVLRKQNKALLDTYANIMGSEDAAYYVLCMNNGYPLEFSPWGQRSDLFRQLLAKNNFSYEDAVLEKAEMYYPEYYNKIGGDWTMISLSSSVVDQNGEPKIKYKPEKIDFSDIIDQPVELTELDTMKLPEIEESLLNMDKRSYIEKNKPADITSLHNTKINWLAEKQKKLVASINKSLLKAFGLEKQTDKDGNIKYVSKQKDAFGNPQLIIQFCEYIEPGKRGAYDQSGVIDAAANVIQISLTNADPSTVVHELAHHYVRMFWNTEVIQKAAKKLDTGDRSEGWQVRLEEKLVEEITDRNKDYSSFWESFADMLKSAFIWLTNPVKQNLLRKASLAFRINEHADAIRAEQNLLYFIDPTVHRVFNAIPNQNVLKFTDNVRVYGINSAVREFFEDVMKHFELEMVKPNSKRRRDFDEYVNVVKSQLSTLSVSDEEFNKIYVDLHKYESKKTWTSIKQGLDCIYGILDEVSVLRDEIKRANATPQTGQEAQQDVDYAKLMHTIIAGLRTRIFEYLHTVPKEARAANNVQQLVDKIQMMQDGKDQFETFLSEARLELRSMYFTMVEAERHGYRNLTSQQIYGIRNMIKGFYEPTLEIIYKTLGKEGVFMKDGVLYQLGQMLRDIKHNCSVIGDYHLPQAISVNVKNNTHDYLFDNEHGMVSDLYTEEQLNRLIENFDDQLIVGKLFEDVNMLQPYIGLASRSKSMIIRCARNMLLAASAEIRHATLKDISKIMVLYAKALPELQKLNNKEKQSIFQEMDKNGKRTGYLVRRLNYGQFYDDLDKYRDSLIEQANQKLKDALGENAPQITYDTYNNPILPPSDDDTVRGILTEYADSLDDWHCNNSERMFTAEYYKMRRKMLSPQTRQIMSNIQSRINTITSKAPEVNVNGTKMRATWELSPEDQNNLMQLRMEYQQLSNEYYMDGTHKSGEQPGDPLRIAQEIQKFNEWKSKRTSYKQNEERFNAAIQNIRAKYGNNSSQEARFRKLNTTTVVNQDYYDWVLSKVTLAEYPELDELRRKRNDLKELIDEFDKKGIDIEKKRLQDEYWQSIKEIDAEIARFLADLPKQEGLDPEELWSTYFDDEMVMYDATTTLLEHMIDQDYKEYKIQNPTDTRSEKDIKKQLLAKYQYDYSYKDKKGNEHHEMRLVSVFRRRVPKGTSVNENKVDAKITIKKRTVTFKNALTIRYSPEFSDIDESSEFYNDKFDKNSSQFVQPREDVYSNKKQWDIINNNQAIKDLYDGIVELLSNANRKLPSEADFNYKLPQITARRMTILRRTTGLKELYDAAKYNWENEWRLNERDDDDVNYAEEIRYRVDGSYINTVPVRYVSTLDDPDKITSDVVGSVIAFVEMANNFSVKTQLSSELELLKEQLSDRSNPGFAKKQGKETTANIVKQLSNMMDDQLYNNNTKLGDTTVHFSKNQQRLIKFMQLFQRLGRRLLLSWNFTSMTVGFLESATRGFIESMLGKSYTMRDFYEAWSNLRKNMRAMSAQTGSTFVNNRVFAEMQYFGISKTLKESYHSTERNPKLRLLHEHLNGMFGYTLGDYANSSFQLSMAMSNMRFIEGSDLVPNGFYTKQTLTKAIQRAHDMGYKEAKAKAGVLYKQSKKNLHDAYELKDGILQKKPEYAQYVTTRIENRITGKCYQRLAEALGMTPKEDNPGYGLQVLMRPLGVLRNYMFTMIARNWNFAHDFQSRTIDANGKIIKVDDVLDGFVDIDAGQTDISMHQGMLQWIKWRFEQFKALVGMAKEEEIKNPNEETQELYNYMAKKVGFEILAITVFVALSTLLKAATKGSDDDDWFYRFGYLTSVRMVNSLLSYLDPTSLLEVIKNISTLISPINDLIRLVQTLMDIIGLSGHSPFEEIKTGSYKGQTRIVRNLLRMHPLGNAYEDLAPYALKYRANWYLQQDVLVWSSIGGAFDQLWGTADKK